MPMLTKRDRRGADSNGHLRRALGIPGLSFFGVGMILGAGIYSVLGAAAVEAGTALWLSFVTAAFVALLTGLSYAELSAMMPLAGAEYVYVSEAAPRWQWMAATVAFMVAASGISTAATVSLAFAGYFGDVMGVDLAADRLLGAHRVIAIAVLFASAAVAIVGIVESSWVNIAFTLIEVGGLMMVIAVGLMSPAFAENVVTAPDLGVFSGAALVFFSFLGFENIANLAEETRNPEKKLPLAILISIGVSTVLYVLVALASVALLSPQELGASDAPLAEAARVRAPVVARVLGAVALFATANTALVSLIVSSRLLYGIAERGAAPRLLIRVSKRETPYAAIWICFALAVLISFLGRVPLVASISSFASLVAFFAVNVVMVVLRVRAPDRKRPFRVPLSLGRVPLPASLGAVLSVLLVFGLESKAQLAGLGILAVAATIAYGLTKRIS